MDHKRHDRNVTFLYIGLSLLIGLAAYVNLVSPDSAFSIALFLCLLMTSVYLLLFFAFNAVRPSMILTISLLLFLLLRMIGLKSPLYILLLAALAVAMHMFTKKN